MQGKWISIEGCGGSGKTTLFNKLKCKYPNWVYIPEFSNELTGVTLKNSIKQGAYILSDSKIGASLLFLSDYFFMCETKIFPAIQKGNIVISDRGFLSKLAVQDAIMSDICDKHQVEECLISLFKLSPKPDYSINMNIPLDIAMERVKTRDGYSYAGQKQLMIKTKKRIEDYSKIFGVSLIDIHNDKDIEDFLLWLDIHLDIMK